MPLIHRKARDQADAILVAGVFDHYLIRVAAILLPTATTDAWTGWSVVGQARVIDEARVDAMIECVRRGEVMLGEADAPKEVHDAG